MRERHIKVEFKTPIGGDLNPGEYRACTAEADVYCSWKSMWRPRIDNIRIWWYDQEITDRAEPYVFTDAHIAIEHEWLRASYEGGMRCGMK